MNKRKFLTTSLGSIGAAMYGHVLPASAQDRYPNRPITFVSPYPAGITLDVISRLYAERVQKILGQPVVVVNKAGAGGLIGTQFVASAPADGYTFLFTNSGHLVLPALNKDLPFDPIRDFKGVSLIAETPTVVIVSPTLGVNNLREFIALAKAKPGTINYASAGVGSATHIAGAYFAQQAGINILHIPYKSSSDIVSDLVSGRVHACFAPPAYVPTLINEGKLKALAIGSTSEIKDPFPAATARSQGLDYVNMTWYGVLAAAKTPTFALEAMDKAMRQVSKEAEVIEKLAGQGLYGKSVVSLGEFDTFLKAESARIQPLVTSAAGRGQ